MIRALLADDSPHAQRMGESILREEGFSVVSVSDGDSAMLRLEDVNPQLIVADVSMPGVDGYRICEYVKLNMPDTIVVLTASAMEPFDEAELARVMPDATLKKPFEATTLRELANRAREKQVKPVEPVAVEAVVPAKPGRGVVILDPDQVRAAVTIAVEAAVPALIDQITEKVMISLNLKPYARQ
jgi:hypothetical protein